MCRGIICSGGDPGLEPPGAVQARGHVAFAKAAGMGRGDQGSGQGPGHTAVPFPEVRTWKEMGDSSFSDILRFSWDLIG